MTPSVRRQRTNHSLTQGNAEFLDDLGFTDVKKQILLAAGVTPESMGACLGMALDVLVAGLQAQRTQYFSHQGIVQDQRTEVDHTTRMKAASELANLMTVLGDMKAPSSSGAGGGTHITLNVPWISQLEQVSTGHHQTIDVSPVSGEQADSAGNTSPQS